MIRAFSCPSSGAQWLQWQPLVLPSYRGDIRAVFVVGPAGPTTNTARLSPRYEGKTRGCHCSHWAPDDGRENARNMLAINKLQDNKLENCCIRLVIYLSSLWCCSQSTVTPDCCLCCVKLFEVTLFVPDDLTCASRHFWFHTMQHVH